VVLRELGYVNGVMSAETTFEKTLFELEQAIAQRADALDRELGIDPLHALAHWRQAENEVWRKVEQTEVSASPVA
jgi:hypothetical protein